MKLFTAIIEIIPGDRKSETKREFQATDMDAAWDKARMEAWRIGIYARVKKVEQI